MIMIRTRNLSRVYRKGDVEVRALDGVDLSVAGGEFLAVTGASGSGKTSLLYILGCLDTPSAGTYHLGDREVSGLSDRELSGLRNGRIGFVFQSFNLIPHLSLLENVEVPLFYGGEPAGRRRERALAAVDAVGLAARTGHFPAELSGGECQRAAIARALVNEPDIILADEPTGNLDSATGGKIMELFEELNRGGRTLIVVTHDQEVAAMAHRRVGLHDGVLVT